MASPCDACPDPGACCRRFQLNWDFQEDTSAGRVQELVRAEGLPFTPVESTTWKAKEGMVRWVFDCPNLLPSGRCGDYENRPDCCRNYRPAQDGLCVLHKKPEPFRPAPMHQIY